MASVVAILLDLPVAISVSNPKNVSVVNSSIIRLVLSWFFRLIILVILVMYNDNTGPYTSCFWGLFARDTIFGALGLLMSSVKSFPEST